jgi:uncharacterized protein YeaO (DUF488 family)
VVNRPTVRVRRVYDEPNTDDGTRVLVDRLWPRGMSKARARLDGANCSSLAQLRDLANHGSLTLLTATTSPALSEAAVLATLLTAPGTRP